MWVQWVDKYYMKGQDPLTCNVPNTCSWALKNILGCRTFIQQIGGWSNSTHNGKYSISKVYRGLQGDHTKVPWRRVICNNHASPRSIFITLLAVLNRLYTADRIQAWGINCSDVCVLCNSGKETVEHLFFECLFSAAVWQRVLRSIGISRRGNGFASELNVVVKRSRKTSGCSVLYVMCFTETVYHIWLARNVVVFRQTRRSIDSIVKDILFRVCCRCSDDLRSRAEYV
ncbi:uncharacterized protein [Spinacia oleracea]|uniref:Reverse transcriptase zinc-binding domain-containing protein n=1 Tax=Spinacia oleracea TaxID=3562 RepID=A0A9R0JGU6_SPIOL|nr:uncharacterized protein LOC110774697 [Spinacia oleracea]